MTSQRATWGIYGWAVKQTVYVVVIAIAGLALPRIAHTQDAYIADVMTIGSQILGDWYARDDAEPNDSHIRFSPDGAFYHGAKDNFGAHPTRWKAERIALIQREALVIEWASKGTCAYYIRHIVKDGTQLMHWQPYRDYRDLGAYDSYVTRAFWPWHRCEERTWARTPPESNG